VVSSGSAGGMVTLTLTGPVEVVVGRVTSTVVPEDVTFTVVAAVVAGGGTVVVEAVVAGAAVVVVGRVTSTVVPEDATFTVVAAVVAGGGTVVVEAVVAGAAVVVAVVVEAVVTRAAAVAAGGGKVVEAGATVAGDVAAVDVAAGDVGGVSTTEDEDAGKVDVDRGAVVAAVVAVVVARGAVFSVDIRVVVRGVLPVNGADVLREGELAGRVEDDAGGGALTVLVTGTLVVVVLETGSGDDCSAAATDSVGGAVVVPRRREEQHVDLSRFVVDCVHCATGTDGHECLLAAGGVVPLNPLVVTLQLEQQLPDHTFIISTMVASWPVPSSSTNTNSRGSRVLLSRRVTTKSARRRKFRLQCLIHEKK
jgi:hypothetical protein